MVLPMAMFTDPEHLTQPPTLFKGIALFTPGGDLVYCVDVYKQHHWHLQLCTFLQELLGLSEPPHFLVPCYSATIDRWLDPQTQQVKTSAEASPLVMRHQALLNAVFGLGDLPWEKLSPPEECHPLILDSYRQQFPQLWRNHDLVVQFKRVEARSIATHAPATIAWNPAGAGQTVQGYVLRLFIAGNSITTERTLKKLHQLLERSLPHPYTLKIIDIHKHPELAEADQIAATPTLVKVYPPPIRRIVGDLENGDQLLRVLQVGE